MKKFMMLLVAMAIASVAPAQKMKLNVSTSGTLSTLLGNHYDVENLVLSGTLNDNDLRFVRTLKKVRVIDMHKLKNQQLGDSAFYGMENLEYVKLPKRLVKLGRSAFEGCVNLSSVEIPGHLETLPDQMLKDCKALDKIYLNNSYATQIGKGAFMNSGLRIIVLPQQLQTIGMTAFANCDRLEVMVIPQWVSEIGALAFANCTRLRDLVINTETPPACASDAFKGLDKCTLSVKHPEFYRDRQPWNQINLSYENYNGDEILIPYRNK